MLELAARYPWVVISGLVVIAFLVQFICRVSYNLVYHPLAAFPGPTAAAATSLWKGYIECFLNKSFCHVLTDLHKQYGDVVRVSPNELHFANPPAYHEIYNQKRRWNKEPGLYRSFNEDQSSFGFLTYEEAKERKDVLNKLFASKAVARAQSIVTAKASPSIDALCNAFHRQCGSGQAIDLYYAFRCLTMDIITFLCFGQSINAIDEPGFEAPIVHAMDASLPVFVRFKHSALYKSLVLNCPPWLSRIISPTTSGLVDLQQLLLQQIFELSSNPSKIDQLPHSFTIYHHLLNAKSYRTNTAPSPLSLYQETQALMFAGGDTTANTLMLASFHLLRDPIAYGRFTEELKSVWPNLQNPAPSLDELERLPYLNAVIKEALRMTSGVVSPLPRVVPAEGADINGVYVPGGTIVSCGSTFVHFDPHIFPEPHVFTPERWLGDPNLDSWLVAFSRGPRMCLGINLAWLELRLAFAHIFRRFKFTPSLESPSTMPFRDTFLPFYYGAHVMAHIAPATE